MAVRVYKGEHPGCVRLKGVVGHEGKKNDIIFHGRLGGSLPSKNVIFFPGDVQEYTEVMLAHRDNGKYVQWNLETTSELLSFRFPDSHVFLIKPAGMNLKTFASFTNFVESSPIGVPTHSTDQGSWQHLQALIENAVKQIAILSEDVNRVESRASTCYSELFTASDTDSETDRSSSKYTLSSMERERSESEGTGTMNSSANLNQGDSTENGWEGTATNTADSSEYQSSLVTSAPELTGPSMHLPLVIIGFSKGCVPMNQLLFDKSQADADLQVATFLSLVEDMYWLDGGHNGGSKTWVNDETVLDTWTGSRITFHAHVTPYQVEDTFRRWIGVEYKRFCDKVKRRGIKLKVKQHFEDEERSLDNHFNVLRVF